MLAVGGSIESPEVSVEEEAVSGGNGVESRGCERGPNRAPEALAVKRDTDTGVWCTQ